MSKATLSNC